MMFLQYAIWGAWLPVAPTYFQAQRPLGLAIDGNQLGILFMLMPLASLFMSPWMGRLADRRFQAQKMLGILHCFSTIFIFLLALQTTFIGSVICLGLHCVVFAPTVALSNSVALANLEDPKGQFASIRVGGTFGWIFSGLVLSLIRSKFNLEVRSDLFMLAAFMNLCLALLSFTLPKTPPTTSHLTNVTAILNQKYKNPLDAISLFKNFQFLAFMIVAFIVCTQFDSYYMHTSGFLTAPKLDSLRGYLPEAAYAGATDGIGIPLAQVSMIMTISQVSEVFMMLLLPFIIKRLGIAWTLWIGIIAWPLRFAIFAFLPMAAAVIPAMALHGLCIACFIVAGSVYVEQVASPEIRASAQGLYSSVTMGIGRVAGAIFAGYSLKQNTLTLPARVSLPGGTELDHLVAWGPLFAIPCGLTLAAAVAFPILFFYRPKVKD